MTEIFSSLFGQNDAQPSTGPAGLGFAAGKPPPTMPSNQAPVAAQIPGQHGDEGPTLRKPGAMNEPFYLLRELPGKYVGSAWEHSTACVWLVMMLCNLVNCI